MAAIPKVPIADCDLWMKDNIHLPSSIISLCFYVRNLLEAQFLLHLAFMYLHWIRKEAGNTYLRFLKKGSRFLHCILSDLASSVHTSYSSGQTFRVDLRNPIYSVLERRSNSIVKKELLQDLVTVVYRRAMFQFSSLFELNNKEKNIKKEKTSPTKTSSKPTKPNPKPPKEIYKKKKRLNWKHKK